MKPVRTADLTNAVPVDDGRGRRTPLTLLHLSVRDCFLRLAADIHCAGMSDRAAAAWLHRKLGTYAASAWRRDYVLAECPPRLAGRVEALAWCALKCSDRVPSERLIRSVLARSDGYFANRLFVAHAV
jgi:hypothetical protein